MSDFPAVVNARVAGKVLRDSRSSNVLYLKRRKRFYIKLESAKIIGENENSIPLKVPGCQTYQLDVVTLQVKIMFSVF
jgi:hypothetical protein